MIITKIRLQEEFPMVKATETWELPYCDLYLDSMAGENGYILKQVEGLQPPVLNEVVEGFDIYGTPALTDIPDNRELAFRVGLNPGIEQTNSSLRDQLYRYISRTVRVKLMNDSLTLAQTVGFIQRFEADLFTNRPEIQMTIQCQEGEFVAPLPVDIPPGELNSAYPVISYQDGTAPTGLDLTFTVTASAPGFTIFDHAQVHSYSPIPLSNEFQLTYPLIVDDEVTISTSPKNRRITLVRASVVYDLAGYINAGGVWPVLYPGINAFQWSLSSSWMEWNNASYIPKYWGV